MVMDKNRVEGTKHQLKGAVRETAGKVTGNKRTEMLGKIENRFGKAQRLIGKGIDRARADQSRKAARSEDEE